MARGARRALTPRVVGRCVATTSDRRRRWATTRALMRMRAMRARGAAREGCRGATRAWCDAPRLVRLRYDYSTVPWLRLIRLLGLLGLCVIAILHHCSLHDLVRRRRHRRRRCRRRLRRDQPAASIRVLDNRRALKTNPSLALPWGQFYDLSRQ